MLGSPVACQVLDTQGALALQVPLSSFRLIWNYLLWNFLVS